MQMLDGSILNTALPAIASSINENPLKIQSIIVAYLLSIAFFLPLSGWLADRFGSKKVFIYAIAIFSLGSLFCAASENLQELVWSRIFQGLGGALMVPVGRLIIIKLYPREQMVRVLSFIMLPALIGPLIGPVVGGFLVEYLNWHWIFLINIPFGLAAIFLCILYMPDVREQHPIKFDWFGFLLFAGAIILMSLSAENTDTVRITPEHKIIMFLTAAFLLGFYWFYSKRISHPLFNTDLFKNISFKVGIIGNLLARLGGGSMPFITPLFLQVGLRFSPSAAGLMMLTTGISGIFAKYFVERLLHFFGYRTFLSINTFLLGSLMCCAVFVDRHSSNELIILILFCFGFVNSLQFTAMTTLTLIDLPKAQTSGGNSLLSVVMQVSMSFGISLGAFVLGRFSNGYAHGSTEMVTAFHWTYLIIGIITVLTTLSFLFTPKNAGR